MHTHWARIEEGGGTLAGVEAVCVLFCGIFNQQPLSVGYDGPGTSGISHLLFIRPHSVVPGQGQTVVVAILEGEKGKVCDLCQPVDGGGSNSSVYDTSGRVWLKQPI